MKRIIFFVIVIFFVTVYASAQVTPKLVAKAEGGDVKSMLSLATYYENGFGTDVDTAAALRWIQKAADLGSCEAWRRISTYYLFGTYLPKDTARYLAIRREWAEKGCAAAISAMGSTYLNGTGVKADTAKALELYKKAATLGDPYALCFMGDACCWNETFDIPKDEKKAVEYWKKALKEGEYFAAVRLCDYYCEKEDYKTAWKYLQMGVDNGDPSCISESVEMYFHGLGVPKDEARAQKIIGDFVNKYGNIPYSLYIAGKVFISPENKALRDTARALQYWRRGSDLENQLCRFILAGYFMDKGDYDSARYYSELILSKPKANDFKGDACYNISWQYFNGLGCERDEQSAETYLRRGYDMYKNGQCASLLGYMYDSDEYADETGNRALAEQYYEKAVEYGDNNAEMPLIRTYVANGKVDKAFAYYDKKIAEGDPDGYYYKAVLLNDMGAEQQANETIVIGDKKGSKYCSHILGEVYANGKDGSSPDYKKAVKYYEKAALPESYYKLALLYLNGNVGKGSDKDISKGLEYLIKSKDMGHVDAYLTLAYCYESGNAVGEVDAKKAAALYQELADNGVSTGYFRLGNLYETGAEGFESDSVKAIENIQRAAELGHGEAMCYMGDYYRIGQFVPMDKEKAFQYYMDADAAGEEFGTYYVARSYLEGCGVAIDTVAAVPYLRRASEMGVGKAAYLIGQFFNSGIAGLEKNIDSVFYYYRIGHMNGSGDASYAIGYYLTQQGNYDQALDYIYTAARRGNIDAIVILGLYVQDGIGTEDGADPEQAYELFEIAASRSKGTSSSAYTYMGKARLQGYGCKIDEVLGKSYLDTAAALGNAEGMRLLALCLYNGFGCQPDSLNAIEWLTRSAELGNVTSMNTLGNLYEENEEYENAVKYYEKGVEAGNLQSMCNMGYCYEKGHGVILSFKKAIDLYTRAAEAGSTRGMKMLAVCYRDGIGVDADPLKAIEWFTKAADLGDAQAMYLIGSIYEEGDTDEYQFKKDTKKAAEWFKKAAAAGYQP